MFHAVTHLMFYVAERIGESLLKTSLDSAENCKSKLLYDWQFYDFENTEVVVPVWYLGSILSIMLIHSNSAVTK